MVILIFVSNNPRSRSRGDSVEGHIVRQESEIKGRAIQLNKPTRHNGGRYPSMECQRSEMSWKGFWYCDKWASVWCHLPPGNKVSAIPTWATTRVSIMSDIPRRQDNVVMLTLRVKSLRGSLTNTTCVFSMIEPTRTWNLKPSMWVNECQLLISPSPHQDLQWRACGKPCLTHMAVTIIEYWPQFYQLEQRPNQAVLLCTGCLPRPIGNDSMIFVWTWSLKTSWKRLTLWNPLSNT